MFRAITFLTCLTLNSFAFALTIPGAIPLGSQGRPATDLFHQGKLKTPDELVELRKAGLDISTLNPTETSDLWKNKISAPLDSKLDVLEILRDAEFQYVSNAPSRLGVFRFQVKQQDSHGQVRLFTVLVSKSNYNYLLRKAVLRKLGYVVPAIQHAPKLRLRFKGSFSRSTFITELKTQAIADPERWVTNLKDTDSEIIDLQDVLLLSANESTYNLAMGFLPSDVIRGRRLLNSLSLVYGLTEVPGTINGFSWKTGRVVDESYVMSFDGVDEFSTPREDAHWILTRLSQLTRQDFVDIAKETHLPEAIQALLVEKLLARSNSMLDAFNIKSARFQFDPEISYGSDLQKGLLKRLSWPGYGSLFSSPNQPVTPLSETEIAAFFKAKASSSGLASLMNIFDSKVLKGTNVEKRVIERQIEAAQRQLQHFFETGEVKKIPFGIFAFPTFDADLIVSRDIVIGQYLGTDNLIQLADTFEMTGSIGIFASATGLPTDVMGIFEKGVRLTKTYTHLKPTQSIVSASKEPYRNLFVQRVLKQQAGVFDELLSHNFSTLDDTKKQEKITALLAEFNKNLKEGESFIISQSLTGSNLLAFNVALSSAIELQPAFYSQRVMLSRLHILKTNDSTIHVYKDDGKSRVSGMGISLKAYIPILSVGFSKGKGQAQTQFYKVNLNGNLKENPEIVGNLVALRQVLEDSSLELLHSQVKPFKIEHQFNQSSSDSSFLFFRNLSIETVDEMKISDQANKSRLFYTSSIGHRKGRDYQGFAIDVVNSILRNEVDKDLIISNIGSGDAGDTFKGHSFLRNASLEVENKNNQVHQAFMNIKYNWKGWKASARKMRSLIGDVNEKFGREVFSPLELYGSSEFQLYSIEVSMFLYQETVLSLLHLSPKHVSKVLFEQGTFPLSPRNSSETYQTWKEKNDRRKKRSIDNILNDQANALKHFQRGHFKQATDEALAFLAAFEGLLPFENFVDLIGGTDGIFVQGRLFGFRDQQENGDVPIVSDTFGRIGSDRPRGGLAQIQNFLGITNSEFMGLWLIRNF
jgi:hypothetical protein